MNSLFKFPRRVRIHGGECGAVARALHHKAQKVALTQNEQSLISDEKALLRQAVFKKSLKTTFIERKQMSIKTLRKRIALVAVSALGFGVMSVAPSQAASTIGTVTISSPTKTGAAGSLISVPFTLTTTAAAPGTAVADDVTTLTVTQGIRPANAAAATVANDTIHSGAVITTTNNVNLLGPGASNALATAAVAGYPASIVANKLTYTPGVSAAIVAGVVAGTLNFIPTVPGTYTFIVTPSFGAAGATAVAGTVTIIVLPSTSSTATLTATNSKPVYTAEAVDAVITVSRNVGGVATDGQILGRVDATANATSSGAIGSIFGTTTAKQSGMTAALATQATAFTMDIDVIANVDAGVYATAGSYTFTFFQDTNSNGVLDSGEPTTTSTVVIGAVSSATSVISAVLSRTLGSTAAGTSSVTVTATVTDVDGNPIVGTVSAQETTSLGSATGDANLTDLADATALTRVGLTNTFVGTFSIDTAVTATDFTDTYITVFTDLIATTATGSAKKVLRVANIADLTAVAGVPTISLTDAVGIGTVTSGVKQSLTASAAADISVTVDKTVVSHVYTFNGAVGNEGEYLVVNVAPAGLTSNTVIAPVTTLLAIGADLTAKYTVTVTAPAATDSYVLTVTGGTTDTSTVVFATAAPEWSVSPASFKAKFGDTSTITGTLSDNFGRILGAKAVYVSVTGRQAGIYNGTTAADGTYAFTWTDASAATTVTLTDVLTFNYNYFASAASTSTTLATSASRTVTYSATGVAVGSITVGAPSATATRPIDMDASVGLPAATSRVTYTASVKDAAGLPVASGALVTFTGGADDLFYGGTTGVTDAFGQASVVVYRTKVGAPAIKATAGGVTSAASAAVQWTNDVLDGDSTTAAPNASSANRQARYITLTADNASVVSEGIIRFTAKVTDRWGNAVDSAQVTFSETGAGRFFNPPTSNQVNTNAAGEASIDLNSQAGETGAVSVTATITQSTALQAINEDSAGFITNITETGGTFTGTLTAVAGVTAAVKTATATATITKDTSVSTADALLELAKAIGTGKSVEEAADAAAEAIDAANAATDAANLAAEAADAATVAAEEARDAADAATAAVEELATQVASLMSALKAQLTTLANTVAKIAKKVKA